MCNYFLKGSLMFIFWLIRTKSCFFFQNGVIQLKSISFPSVREKASGKSLHI